MKQTFYLKLAKDKLHLKASIHSKPDFKAMTRGYDNKLNLPTVVCALTINIDDSAFDPYNLELNANIKMIRPAIEVTQVGIEEEQHD